MAEQTSGLELRSLLRPDGIVELSLANVAAQSPADDQVLVRVEAAPINPSDMGLLLPSFDLTNAAWEGEGERTRVLIKVPDTQMPYLQSRLNKSLPIGNEGAGTVIKAGSSDQAKRLLGRRVAIRAGGMFAEYRLANAGECLELPAGASAEQGASCFVNPMTALCMVSTMRRERHSGLVHTAAASNLGQMLVKLCHAEKIGLVNIVRRPEQADILHKIGAVHVCDSSSKTFTSDLTNAIAATGSTLAFDAVGGGELASQILTSMELASSGTAANYSRYGSTRHKQVYLYGSLHAGEVRVARNFGMAWGIGGWLRSFAWEYLSPTEREDMRQRVVNELSSTFATTYSHRVPLRQMLEPGPLSGYLRRATGEKYLVVT